jgi:hypothetical protein
MRDIGWYLAFNDYWDSEIRGSLYSKGSWEASINTRYTVNYKFNGGFNIRYANTKTGIEGTSNYGSNKDFNVTWNHTQRWPIQEHLSLQVLTLVQVLSFKIPEPEVHKTPKKTLHVTVWARPSVMEKYLPMAR